jgi:hypothetical protein
MTVIRKRSSERILDNGSANHRIAWMESSVRCLPGDRLPSNESPGESLRDRYPGMIMMISDSAYPFISSALDRLAAINLSSVLSA